MEEKGGATCPLISFDLESDENFQFLIKWTLSEVYTSIPSLKTINAPRALLTTPTSGPWEVASTQEFSLSDLRIIFNEMAVLKKLFDRLGEKRV